MQTQTQKGATFSQKEGGDSMNKREVRYLQVRRIVNFIWLLFGILEGVIGIRILLKLVGANPNNAFASFIYNITEPFLAYFEGLTNNPSFMNGVLELHSFIAIAAYAFVSWIIVRLIWLILYRPEEAQ